MIEPLATAMGETPNGEWPWPQLLGLLGKASYEQTSDRNGPNTEGLWPTPVTKDDATNYAQGGMSLGFAARNMWPTPNTLDGAPPRDPETVHEWNNARDGRTGRQALANLRQAVVDPKYQERFPTPRAEDSESAGAHRGVPDTLTSYTRARPSLQMFCTPTVEDASRSGDPAMAEKWARGERVPDTHQRLRTQVLVESFPTPTVYDSTGTGSKRAEQKDGSRHAVSLHHLAADWSTNEERETFPTPTSSMMSVGDMEQARFAGSSGKRPNYKEANESWPTPKVAGSNRTSKQALLNEKGHASGLGLEQAAELADGVIPQELEGIEPSTLAPGIRAQWPTPMAGSNRTSTKAQTGRPTSGPSRGGASYGLEDAVLRVEQWPTPTTSDATGGPGNSGREGGDNLRTAVSKFPTPRANDWKGADPARDENRSGLRHGGDDLAMAVDKLVFPTPTVSDATGGRTTAGGHKFPTSLNAHVRGLRDGMDGRKTWPTPLSGNPDSGSGGNHGGMALLDAAKEETNRRTWPTPMAGPIHVQDGGGHGGVKLAEVATEASFGTPTASMKVRSGEFGEGRAVNPAELAYQESGARGQLNPDWVEWLMGWPKGWTTTDPLPPEVFADWIEQTLSGTWWDQEPAGVPRIAVGIPHRVSRLKAIGNGQVSLCAAWAAVCLFEMEQQVRNAIEVANQGSPPEVDFFDLVDG